MYRRYSQVNGEGAPHLMVKRNRIRNLVILMLLAAVAALAVIAVPAIQYRQGERTLYIHRIQSECDEAIRLTTSLSRNAGADSAAILARIRSNLYAIRVLNAVYMGQESGRQLVAEDQIMTLQNTVDRYLSYLTTGMDTGEYQTNLQNALDELRRTLDGME